MHLSGSFSFLDFLLPTSFLVDRSNCLDCSTTILLLDIFSIGEISSRCTQRKTPRVSRLRKKKKKKKKNAGSETGNSDTRYFFPFPDTTSFQACGRCDIDDAVISVCLPTKRIKQTRRSDDDWNKDSRP